jgi:hypothetical protein
MVASTETGILERVVESSLSQLAPATAKAILRLRFGKSDLRRMNELSALAQEGSLSPTQRRELEVYDRVGQILGVMQSKARMSLNKPARR